MGHRLVSGPYLKGRYNRRRVVPAIVTFGSTGDVTGEGRPRLLWTSFSSIFVDAW
jgi:hypothetical protein